MTKYVVVTVVALFAVGCGKGSAAGSYTLDKASMTKAMDEKMAKLPKEQQAMGKLAAELIKLMDVKLNLKDGGKGEMVSTMPDILGKGKPEAKTEAVTWELKGEELTISGGKKPVKCSLQGKQLKCSDGKDEMIFQKS